MTKGEAGTKHQCRNTSRRPLPEGHDGAEGLRAGGLASPGAAQWPFEAAVEPSGR